MEASILISIVIAVILPVLGWFAKQWAANAHKKADDAHARADHAVDQLHQIKLHVAENYVSLKRFESFEKAIFDKLDAISDKIDKKADK